MFSIRIHHGGRFRMYLGRMYVSVHEDIFDMVDIGIFTVIALNVMVVKLGYTCESEPLFYNYLRSLTSLDKGLYALVCDGDVRFLATLVRSFKFMEVYIEHGVTALDCYIRPPWFRATIEDIIDELGSIATNRTGKMLFLTWHESSEQLRNLFVTMSHLALCHNMIQVHLFSLVDNSKLNDVDLFKKIKNHVSLLEGLFGGKKDCFKSKRIKQIFLGMTTSIVGIEV
ncbi:hypothetical protein Tco_0743304 [Tanacetum coccineum]